MNWRRRRAFRPILRFATEPGVVQPVAEYRPDVEVGRKHRLLEGRAVGEQRTFGVEDHRVAVEDQLVLAPDGVHPGHESVRVGGAGGDHPDGQ